MKYKHFKKVNKIAKEKSAIKTKIIEYNVVNDSLLVEQQGDKIQYLGKEFIERLMTKCVFYVSNPKELKDSELISGYHIKRRLQLQRIVERNYLYNEFYEAENYENQLTQNNLYLIIDYLCFCSTLSRYKIKLGNFMFIFLDNCADDDKIIKSIFKMVNKKLYKYNEINCLTKSEKEWLKYALMDEIRETRKSLDVESNNEV